MNGQVGFLVGSCPFHKLGLKSLSELSSLHRERKTTGAGSGSDLDRGEGTQTFPGEFWEKPEKKQSSEGLDPDCRKEHIYLTKEVCGGSGNLEQNNDDLEEDSWM